MAGESPRRARRRIVAYLYAMHAISPEDAVSYQPQNSAERAELAAMRRRAIVRVAAEGQYWIDRGAYDADMLRRERRLLPLAVAMALAVAGVAVRLYQG